MVLSPTYALYSKSSILRRLMIGFEKRSSLHSLCTKMNISTLKNSNAHQRTVGVHHKNLSTVNLSSTSGDASSHGEVVTPLMRQLSARIRATGAITVADFMKEVLANPIDGYYTQHPGIGADGDFITAPELTPIFGELIGVWLLHEWQRLGAPAQCRLIELGPGKGSLMSDILDVWQRLVRGVVPHVHLVENSVAMVTDQVHTLGVHTLNMAADQLKMAADNKSNNSSASGADVTDVCSQLCGVTRHGFPVSWHCRLQDVTPPPSPSTLGPPDVTVAPPLTLLVANEFFDTMPTHQFRRTKDGWREVMVDVEPDNPLNFRFVLSTGSNPSSVLLSTVDESALASASQLEISPQCHVWMDRVATCLAASGATGSASHGVALIIDYGQSHRAVSASADTPAAVSAASASADTPAAVSAVSASADTPAAVSAVSASADTPAAVSAVSASATADTPAAVSAVFASAEGCGGGVASGCHDYGDTLRAFRRHCAVHPLHHALGTADITCDIDFEQLKQRLHRWRPGRSTSQQQQQQRRQQQAVGVEEIGTDKTATVQAEDGGDDDEVAQEGGAGVVTFGPVTQRHFLNSLGLQHRLQSLAESQPEKLPHLKAVYRILTESMGERFKVMAIYSSESAKKASQEPPPGF